MSAAGLRATREFGTCSDIIYPISDGKAGITVVMIGFMGDGESQAVQKKPP